MVGVLQVWGVFHLRKLDLKIRVELFELIPAWLYSLIIRDIN